MLRPPVLSAAALGLALAFAAPAGAVQAPYESQMLRLGEVLGSLHYLKNLCGEHGSIWRDRMESLIASENPPPDVKARLTAGFNRGYRAFSGTYVTCTPSATEAIKRYMQEGATLTREMVARYGS